MRIASSVDRIVLPLTGLCYTAAVKQRLIPVMIVEKLLTYLTRVIGKSSVIHTLAVVEPATVVVYVRRMSVDIVSFDKVEISGRDAVLGLITMLSVVLSVGEYFSRREAVSNKALVHTADNSSLLVDGIGIIAAQIHIDKSVNTLYDTVDIPSNDTTCIIATCIIVFRCGFICMNLLVLIPLCKLTDLRSSGGAGIAVSDHTIIGVYNKSDTVCIPEVHILLKVNAEVLYDTTRIIVFGDHTADPLRLLEVAYIPTFVPLPYAVFIIVAERLDLVFVDHHDVADKSVVLVCDTAKVFVIVKSVALLVNKISDLAVRSERMDHVLVGLVNNRMTIEVDNAVKQLCNKDIGPIYLKIVCNDITLRRMTVRIIQIVLVIDGVDDSVGGKHCRSYADTIVVDLDPEFKTIILARAYPDAEVGIDLLGSADKGLLAERRSVPVRIVRIVFIHVKQTVVGLVFSFLCRAELSPLMDTLADKVVALVTDGLLSFFFVNSHIVLGNTSRTELSVLILKDGVYVGCICLFSELVERKAREHVNTAVVSTLPTERIIKVQRRSLKVNRYIISRKVGIKSDVVTGPVIS